jgi:hypothetical protein
MKLCLRCGSYRSSPLIASPEGEGQRAGLDYEYVGACPECEDQLAARGHESLVHLVPFPVFRQADGMLMGAVLRLEGTVLRLEGKRR